MVPSFYCRGTVSLVSIQLLFMLTYAVMDKKRYRKKVQGKIYTPYILYKVVYTLGYEVLISTPLTHLTEQLLLPPNIKHL